MTGNAPLRLVAIALLLQSVSNAQDDLARSFEAPPDTARPGVYWYFMDGNLSREGMTADLESMKKAGIGNLIFLEVNVGVPRGPVDFMSDRWQDLFVHAVRETERLGIEITLGSGPGWCGSGGPWVKAEQSMQHLVFSEVEVTGPRSFDGLLPVPEQRSTTWHRMRSAFYEDVVVYAFPRCEPGVADIDEKALYERDPYSSAPGVRPYLSAPPEYRKPETAGVIVSENLIDLSDRLQEGGRLTWDVPAGEWTILRMGRRPTGASSRPAPEPGIGLECDKLTAAALDDHFDHYVGRLLRRVGARKKSAGWTMLHIDSWEMGAQNWTPTLPEEFERRRGYDPRPFYPAYSGRIVGSLETTERFLWDLRVTAQELVLENHAGRLKELGRRHGLRLSIEPYDMNPTADLDLGSVADVPMCEFWSRGLGFDTAYSCIEASSIAHTNGRSIVAAEAFTAGGGEAWKLYPAAIKNQGDWAFCAGINRLVYHTFAHKPHGRRPGMAMGPYGVHWDRGQTWWPMVAAYHRYIARCQFLLRQGTTVADICYLAPEGAPHVFRPPPSALEGPDDLRDRRGYNFDGCSPRTLVARASVRDGRVEFPGGAAFRLLVLPSCETMTPELLRKITELVEAGATVIGPPPRKSPSLVEYPRCDEQVASLAAALWGRSQPPVDVVERRFGRGRVVWGGDLQVEKKSEAAFPHRYPDYGATARLLARRGLPPDFETDGPLRYTHRSAGELELYFVANREAREVEASCTFRVAGRAPELWDPLTGAIRDLPEHTERAGRTTVPMRFEPHQSFFVVFRRETEASRLRPPATRETNFTKLTTLGEIDGPWSVDFDPGLNGPGRVSFRSLEDWSQSAETGIKHYSGIATYRKTFDLPATVSPGEHPVLLDLGVVHSIARARLNGHDLGVVWCAPWRVDISEALRAKGNRLEIDVANLWPNRLIGDKALPSERQVAWTTYNPYRADSPLLPSGLLGPVRFVRPQ